jgi:hypothetical protein
MVFTRLNDFHNNSFLVIVLTLAWVLVSGCVTAVGAQCAYVSQVLPRSVNNPYEYVRTVIESLSFAHQASLVITSDTSATYEGLVTNLKRARDDYKCAASMVEKFESSTEKLIKATAPAVSYSYETISQLYQKEVSAVTQYLKQVSKGQTPPRGSTLDQMTDLGRSMDKSLEVLAQAIVQAGSSALVEWTDQTPQARQTGRLRITESQRRALMKQIEGAFGTHTIQKGPIEGPQPVLEVTAIVLYQWLSDPKRRSAD